MCYNCDDKYTPDHKCKANFFLLVGDEEVQDSVIMEELGAKDDTIDSIIYVFLKLVCMH